MVPDLQRISRRVVGAKQLARALDAGRVAEAFIALDADTAITNPVREKSAAMGITVTDVPTMAKLGEMCGIAVGAACAGLLLVENEE